jgi:hypothetical protein
MSVLQEVLKANEAYAASFGAKSQLALPPARHFAILTCMNARLDPAKYANRKPPAGQPRRSRICVFTQPPPVAELRLGN